MDASLFRDLTMNVWLSLVFDCGVGWGIMLIRRFVTSGENHRTGQQIFGSGQEEAVNFTKYYWIWQ
jgi:hypothetical protein